MKKLAVLLLALLFMLPTRYANAAGIKQGDIITFGSYEQDNDLENGKEPIEWIVLSVEGSKALLLSKYGLDAKSFEDYEALLAKYPDLEGKDYCFDPEYYNNTVKITWEECTLRNWLNNDFYNEAFNEEEKQKVVETLLENEDNPVFSTEGGADTQDRVFLLSMMDINNTEYGFDENQYNHDIARRCAPTEYAKAHGAETLATWYDDDQWKYCLTSDGEIVTWWWLRSPGQSGYFATYIYFDGYLLEFGGGIDFDGNAVRPSIYLDISQNLSMKGDVNGDETIDAKDVTALRRFLAGGWNVEINEANSDINGDNTIDAKDVTMLRRFLAGGWGVTLQ